MSSGIAPSLSLFQYHLQQLFIRVSRIPCRAYTRAYARSHSLSRSLSLSLLYSFSMRVYSFGSLKEGNSPSLLLLSSSSTATTTSTTTTITAPPPPPLLPSLYVFSYLSLSLRLSRQPRAILVTPHVGTVVEWNSQRNFSAAAASS